MSFIPVAAALALSLSMPADAQRRGAPVSQGVTTSELATTIGELRVANAELGARITGLESDNATLYGQLETLEFLLSQSRDQINDMQGDDAEIGSLISKLENRLRNQDRRMKALETKLEALEAKQTESAMETLTRDGAASETNDTSQRPTVRRTVVTADGRTIELEPSPPQAQGETTRRPTLAQPATLPETSSTQSVTSGPTRIVRRPSTSDSAETNTRTVRRTVTTTQSQPQNSVTVTGARTVTTQPNAQNQGSLGTIPASALPGGAGPLFAEAKSRLLDFDYAGAETAFSAFLNKFGDDPQAGEAQYWLAEVLYQQKEYAESGKAYTTMIRSYPDDQRAPEALAKLARSMRLVGDTEQACGALNLLPNRYPDASGVTKALAAGERAKSGCDS